MQLILPGTGEYAFTERMLSAKPSGPSGATFDPVLAAATPGLLLSNHNLTMARTGLTGDNAQNAKLTSYNTSGKYYVEFTMTTYTGASSMVGMCNSSMLSHTSAGVDSMGGSYVALRSNGQCFSESGGFLGFFGALAFGLGDVLGVAFDFSTGVTLIQKNGGGFQSIPHLSAGGTYTPFAGCDGSTSSITLNSAPASPPSGYGPWL